MRLEAKHSTVNGLPRAGNSARKAAVWLLAVLVGTGSAGLWPEGAWGQDPSSPARTERSKPHQPTLRALSDFNRGSALMERYEYSDAVKAFEAVVQLMPDWTAARFNLGLAYLNMHGSKKANESLDIARDMFLGILEVDPGNLHAQFCLGMYYQHLGDNDKAIVYFTHVYQADPDDPYVGFKYAETLIAIGRTEDGVKALEKVVETDPGFYSATYRLALLYRRYKGIQESLPLFKRFQELKPAELAGGTFAVQKTYGTVGKYYRLLGADGHPLARRPSVGAQRPVFSPAVKDFGQPACDWAWSGGSIHMPGIAVSDVDRDGDLDVLLTATGKGGGAAVWLNNGSGEFRKGSTVNEPGVSPTFGDIDNDGDDDLVLGCAQKIVMLMNDGTGVFTPAGLPGAEEATALVPLTRLVDVDSDGDLDVLAFRQSTGSVPADVDAEAAASSIYNNNGDGSFVDVAEKLGLELADYSVAAVVCDDLDDDRDLDIVILPTGSRTPLVWVNDRMGAYRIVDAPEMGIECKEVVSATTGDPDKDGDRDLLVFTKSSISLFENLGRFRFRRHREFARRFGALRATGGQFADMDNDGDVDLLIADAHRRDGTRGPMLLINNGSLGPFVDVTDVDPGNVLRAIEFMAIDTQGDASCVAADFTGNGRCDVLLAAMGQKPMLVENITPGGHWISLDLRGTKARDTSTRSNFSAIGARVEVKTGNVFQQYVIGGTSGPVSAPPLRVHAGLGENPKVDWLRVVWPDGVLQAELEIAGDKVATVTEVSRKESSCPYLFAWNGNRFEYVSDFGGVGGLGYLVEPGTYAPPDSTEYVPIPNLAPRDGYYVLNALTVLEEVTYFDEAKLVAVDHPAGSHVLPNEMMAINVSPPEFEVFCFRKPILPKTARDHRGADVTDELSLVDRRYAGATQRDLRFAGFAQPHFVQLDFDDRLAHVRPQDRLVLVAYGWVEYGYSSTNYAASQARLRTEAPSISVLRDGRWVELFHEVGYPAGTQHVMTLEVTGKILPTDRVVRISSNMDLYWDRIHLAVHQSDERLRIRDVAATKADLRYFGFPREYSPDGRHPNLSDYENLDRASTWKLMSGDYTRYGEVTELVERTDDCFVIMGRGEQLTLKFPVEAFGPVPRGYRRSFLLKADSYCKDMNLYTAHPDTVEPLPFHAMSGYPYGPQEHYPDDARHIEYRRQYNTRKVRVRSSGE